MRNRPTHQVTVVHLHLDPQSKVYQAAEKATKPTRDDNHEGKQITITALKSTLTHQDIPIDLQPLHQSQAPRTKEAIPLLPSEVLLLNPDAIGTLGLFYDPVQPWDRAELRNYWPALYKTADAGNILYDLSQKSLPRDLAISSVGQLAAVGILMQNKLEVLGFGNLLARQVTRIHAVYEQLGLNLPDDFLDPISAESMTDLLRGISQALREPSLIIRITGTRGLGQVLGLILIMFPEDTIVTDNGLVDYEAPRKSILVEIDTSLGTNGISRSQVENVLTKSVDQILSLTTETDGKATRYCAFVWNNWVADFLQLSFLNLGLICPPDVIMACCDIVGQLPRLAKFLDRSLRII
ncbi:MAG: hypothetical protein MMC33_007310 [Icmadophila ericetorum]|nr:hypothetical protein [Icmadophila ericetorum]